VHHAAPARSLSDDGQKYVRVRNESFDLLVETVTVGEGLVEAPPELETVEMLRGDAVAKEKNSCWNSSKFANRQA